MPSEEEEDSEPVSFAKIFRDYFSYYLHLGMSYDEYWRMDCTLVRDYRRAYELKQEYDNTQLWLQGLYVYKALEAQRPGWAFYGRKTPKPREYLDKPIAVTKELRDRYANETTQKMAAELRAKFHKANQYREKQGGGKDGSDSGNINN